MSALDDFMRKYGSGAQQQTPQEQTQAEAPTTLADFMQKYGTQTTPQSSGSAAHGKSLTAAQITQSIDGLDRQFLLHRRRQFLQRGAGGLHNRKPVPALPRFQSHGAELEPAHGQRQDRHRAA